jgi:hypothetical protein
MKIGNIALFLTIGILMIMLTGCPPVTINPINNGFTNPVSIDGLVYNSLINSSCTFLIMESSGPVTTAIIKINGANVLHYGTGIYMYSGSTFPVGSTVTFSVTINGGNITESISLPSIPIVTSPASGSSQNPVNAITVLWNSISPPPDYTNISVDSSYTDTGTTYKSDFGSGSGTATSAEIPAGTLKAATNNVTVSVFATNQKPFIGTSFLPGSLLTVDSAGTSPSFNVQ